MKRSLFTLIIALSISAASYAQLSGTYYVPSGSPGYPTLQAAIADLNTLGMNGNVTFIVADDYTETAPTGGFLLGSALLNANSVNYTLTFQRSGTGTNAPLLTAWVGTTTNLDGIWKIAGTDNVTIDGIDLTESVTNATQTTRMEFGYALLKLNNTLPVDGCQSIVIRNCTITLLKASPTTNSTGIYAGNHITTALSAINLTGGISSDAMNNCQFFNNTITNVKNGIDISGYNAPEPYDLFNQNIEIGVGGANIITDFNTYGISVRYLKAYTVANNSISSGTATPVSSLIGIVVFNTTHYDIFNNTVTLTPSAAIAIQGISAQTGVTGYTSNIYGNTVQNCTNAAATFQAFTGIACTGSPGTLNFYSNTVTNNSIAGTGQFTGIDSGSAGTLYMYSNNVFNNTKTGISGTFVCMRAGASSGSGTANSYDNNIYSNYNATSAGINQGGTITGIISNSGNLVKIYQNRVYDLSTAGSGTSAIVNGISVSGTNMNVYNNFVSDLRSVDGSGTLINPLSSVNGINVSGGTVANIFYNTVYLNASSTQPIFYTSALFASTNPVLDLRNNILVNMSTTTSGIVSAFRRNNATLTTYSNNSNANVFYVNEEEEDFLCVTYFDGTDALFFNDYQTLVGPARDAGSFRELPPFVNIAATPYDLHIQTTITTVCESGGVQITSPIAITEDFDGDLRASIPDIGADEFMGLFSGVLNPSGVSTTLFSSSQIDVAFTPNSSTNNVVIVWNTTGVFTTPTGTPPSNTGDPLAGGFLLYNGTISPVSHIGLTGATSYYYKAFSYDGSAYSNGVVVSNITNIAPPSNLMANSSSDTQIDLSWTKNAFNSDVIIATNNTNTFGQPVNGTAYSVNDPLPDAGTVIYVGPLSAFNHTGLTPNLVTYYYKAWSYESANNNIFSPTGVTANATTLCGSYPIPFVEGFESGSVGCGTFVDQNVDFSTWNVYYGPSQAHSGDYSIRISSNFVVSVDDWYFTNGLDLTAGVNYTVKFWTKISTALAPQNLEVLWGTSPTAAGMTSPPIYSITGMSSTSYSEITCSFTPASSGIYYVGWHCFSNPGNGFLYLDDISVYDPLFAIWTGAINSDWANIGNWVPNSVPGPGVAVTIQGGLTNYPTITAPASCGSINIASGASLLDNGYLTVSGSATVNREYDGGEWHLISSPVSGATANMFQGLYLQNHTESTNAYTDITNPATPLNVMKGYALWNDLAGTASFAGTLNTGNIGAANNVTRNGQGWNLVGNPYASSIDWDAATGWTKTNLDNATYRHVNNATWAEYVGGVGANGGTRYIASCQGFFVGVTDGETTGTLSMTNDVRTHNTAPFFKDEVADVVRLEVSGNGYTNETVIRFLDVATPGFDGQWDAHKLFGSVPEAPAIYSADNGMMAINSLPATNTVPVGVKAGLPGEFTITATETSDFSHVILEDFLTGVVTDLKTSSYTFSYDLSFDNRFIVHFTPLTVGEVADKQISIYSNQKDVYVSAPFDIQGKILVYNLMGQEIAREQTNGILTKISLDKSAIYIVKVINGEVMVSEKVFIR